MHVQRCALPQKHWESDAHISRCETCLPHRNSSQSCSLAYVKGCSRCRNCFFCFSTSEYRVNAESCANTHRCTRQKYLCTVNICNYLSYTIVITVDKRKQLFLTGYPTLQVTKIVVKVSNYGIWLTMGYMNDMEVGIECIILIEDCRGNWIKKTFWHPRNS